MQIACSSPKFAKDSLEMNNLGPCHDTFWSDKRPKKRHFARKIAKTIENRSFESNKFGIAKVKLRNADCLLSPQDC